MGVTAPSDGKGTTVADTEISGRAAGEVTVTTGRVIAGRYEVQHLLGRGGMGVVFAAYDHALRELVAIKVLRPELAAERCWVERLAREVRLARQVQHPNVCRVFDFVQVDGLALVVMELARRSVRAEHAPCDEMVNGGGALLSAAPLEPSLESRLKDASAIMAGLAAIHAAGIVHRDITLANVLRLADGRVALSDFGLATDAEATSASVHGGTVAYMAPELAFGVRASFASDVWALGVVLHEVVFGERPRWSRGPGDHVLSAPARRLTGAERTIFEICRRCLSLDPAARPRDGGAAEKLYLCGRDGWSRRWRPPSRRFPLAVAVVLAGAGVVTAFWSLRPGRRRTEAASPATHDPQPIVVTGAPEDWTETSTALVTLNGAINGLAPLPDQRSIRFVWGSPRRAEDLDIVTGQIIPAPIVPKSYAEGCPDLSPDGRSLIYQGYDDNGQPHVFKSNAPDGSGAQPIASSVVLSTASEPRWLTRDAIVYNPDAGHLAVFEISAGRTVIIRSDSGPTAGSVDWRIIDGGAILTGSQVSPGLFQERVLTWPYLRVQRTFTMSGSAGDCVADSSALYCSNMQEGVLSRLDMERGRGDRMAAIAGQEVTLLAVVGRRLVFVSRRVKSDAWLVPTNGARRRLTDDGVTSNAADCGAAGFLISNHVKSGIDVVRINPDGKREVLQTGAWDFAVECSKTSNDWWFTRSETDAGLFHCKENSCERIVSGDVRWPSLSPDGTRIAFFTYDERGQSVKWLPSTGGPVHDVTDSEGSCGPGWSSPSAMWVSRQVGGHPLWTEVDAESGRPTGRTSPSANDCQGGYFGYPDPLSPVRPEIRIVSETTSQIRMKELPPAPPS